MSKLLENFSNQMNTLRYNYVDINNKIYEKVNTAISYSKTDSRLINPPLTNFARSLINENLYLMQRRSVVALEDILGCFLELDGTVTWNKHNMIPRRFSKGVVEGLEDSFKNDQYPSDSEKLRLARQYKLSTKQVNNWFTNKRNRTKYSASSSRYSSY